MPNLFKEDKKTYFFTMDLGSQNSIILNDEFFKRLEKIDMFLLNKIEIGTEVKFQ